ncbi:restriction endonuclease subunit S [Chryseobacterium arthrosphaerae]|uniref:restriction endonuclease subunit S n=1 Tax=Chryseobacterium arthrosphaerae TaxID=651561 RepID=UPI001F4A263B|nr:restriction endonuclease subunit S [Chryseobacterium arthrosphaerae]
MDNKLPQNWVECKLGNIVNVLNGYAFKSSDYSEVGIPVIRMSDITDNKINTIKSVKVSEKKDYDKFIISKGDILIGMSGSIGKYGIFNLNEKVYLNQRVGNLRLVAENLSNKKFIYYFIGQFQKEIAENAYGGTVPNISSNQIEELKFKLPPLSEQNRIVVKLDALFTKHEAMKKALERIPQLLKDFRQQVLTHAVTGNLVPFRGSQNMKLKDLGIWKGGGTPSKANSSFWNNGTILWITPKDMKDLFLSNSIDKITKSAVQNSSAILIPKNSILIVTRSGILRRLLPISSNSVETTVNQDLKVLIPNDKVNFKFLLYALRGLEENIRMTCMKSGTTVESIEFSLLKDYNINIPILSIQQAIVEKIESLLTKADIIEKRYKTLKEKIDRLPQAILHKAFKGELVPQLPTDGDAKDLLEEILKLKKEVKKK